MKPRASSSSPRVAQRQRLGRRGERLAIEVLQARGYRIEATNVRYPIGEIDIVARDGQTLCFVEVRSASSLQWGGAMASVSRSKQQRLIRAARWYLNQTTPPPSVRFDVVAIQWSETSAPQVELIQDAFVVDSVPW